MRRDWMRQRRNSERSAEFFFSVWRIFQQLQTVSSISSSSDLTMCARLFEWDSQILLCCSFSFIISNNRQRLKFYQPPPLPSTSSPISPTVPRAQPLPLLFLIMDSKKRSTIHNTEYFPKGAYRTQIKDELTTAGVANILARTLLAPLERWRIIAQTQMAYPLRPKKFTSFFDFLAKAPKEQGFTSLWRSNMVYCWVYLYQTLFQITVFDSIKSFSREITAGVDDAPFLVGLYDTFLIPLAASTSSLAIIHPLDTYRVHTAMLYHREKKDALFQKFRQRFGQMSSVKELYKGFWLANFISLITFNFYRQAGAALGKIEVEGVPQEILNTQNVLSALAVLLVHPLDTFKKILQLNNLSRPPLFSGYSSVFKYFSDNKISPTVFYRGLTASMTKTILFMPLYWGIQNQWTSYRND